MVSNMVVLEVRLFNLPDRRARHLILIGADSLLSKASPWATTNG